VVLTNVLEELLGFLVPSALTCKSGEEREEVWGQILLLFALLKIPLETRNVLTWFWPRIFLPVDSGRNLLS